MGKETGVECLILSHSPMRRLSTIGGGGVHQQVRYEGVMGKETGVVCLIISHSPMRRLSTIGVYTSKYAVRLSWGKKQE